MQIKIYLTEHSSIMLPVWLTFSEEALKDIGIWFIFNLSQNMQIKSIKTVFIMNKVDFLIGFNPTLFMDPYVDGFFGSSLSSSLG